VFDLASGPDGSIWTLRAADPQVCVISADGTIEGWMDIPEVSVPGGIAIAADGTVAVSDRLEGEILVYGPEGAFRYAISAPGSPGAVAWSGTDIWYCSLDRGGVFEAGGAQVLSSQPAPAWLQGRGRRGLAGMGDFCLLFSPTESPSDTIRVSVATFAGDSVLALPDGLPAERLLTGADESPSPGILEIVEASPGRFAALTSSGLLILSGP